MGVILESVLSEFVNTSHPFPDDGLNLEYKNSPAFYKRLSDAILGNFSNNLCVFPWQWTKTRSIATLRSYGMGEQDLGKYKSWVCNDAQQNGGKSFVNISWSPVRSIPLFRNVIKGIALKTIYDVSVNCIDPSSAAERNAEEAFHRLSVNPEWVGFTKEMKQMGVNVPAPKFKSDEQIDVWMKSGGLKLAVEIAVKTALEATLHLSRWDDNVKVEVIDDIIDLGFACTRDYVEPGTRYVKGRYVDPEYYVGRFSQFLDNHNSDYGAEIRFMTIAELRPYFSEAQLLVIAKKYMNNFGNSGTRFAGYGIFNSWNNDRYRDVYGNNPIDDFKVPVLDGVYVTANYTKYSRKTRKNGGNLIYAEVPNEYEMSIKDKDAGGVVEQKRNDIILKWCYVIGSDAMIFNYGEDTDIVHDGKDGFKRAVNPYHVYKTGEPSIVDKLVGTEDDMCLATYKQRNAETRIPPPPNLWFDKGILENITLGGVKMTPKQVISMYTETGYGIMQTLSDHGRAALSSNAQPIFAPPNTYFEYFNAYVARMNQLWAEAFRITGINDLTAAGSPEERQGKGVMDNAVQLSNNVISPLFKAYEVLFEQTMVSCAKRWQSVLRNGDIDGLYKAIGSSNLQTFKLTKNISMVEFGLTIQALPSDSEKELLLSQLLEATKMKEISRENYVLIYRTIKSGNLDLAQLQMAWAYQQELEIASQMKMQDIQANAQMQQQSLQAKALSDQAALEQAWGYKEKEIMLMAQVNAQAAAQNHSYAMQELSLKGQYATEQKHLGETSAITQTLLEGENKIRVAKEKPKPTAK